MSREAFLKNLADSGLSGVMSAGNVGQAETGVWSDGVGLARELVAAGQLTDYQAAALLDGRLTDLRIGNYEVLDKLGAGAMGTVYKARHRRMKRIVAIKTLNRSADPDGKFLARFQREVEIIAQLIHPNIVMAFDADEGESGPFLVMEFVDGKDLATLIAKQGPLAVNQAVDYTLQAARGLAYAHGHGLIHRDIKPANMMLSVAGVIKVADLGLARLMDDQHTAGTSLTQAGGVVGTIDYMPPEQAVDSTSIDARADQYSLGCTLHFFLTGMPIYTGSSAMGVLLKHRDAAIPSLAHVRPGTPPELDAIFQKMVAKRPEDRFPHFTEVIAALEALPPLAEAPRESVPAAAPMRAQPPSVPAAATAATIDPGLTGSFSSTEFPHKLGPSVAGLSLVLVEASRTQVGIMRKQLEELGIRDVRVATSGAQALDLARAAPPHVLLSSMHHADMTGTALGRKLRGDPILAQVGFILTTSEVDAALEAEVSALGQAAVLPKPFELVRLSKLLADVARRA
jgi:serine/threonine protein kinase